MSLKNKSSSSLKQQQTSSKSTLNHHSSRNHSTPTPSSKSSSSSSTPNSSSSLKNTSLLSDPFLQTCSMTKQSACCILIPSSSSSTNDNDSTNTSCSLLFDHIQHLRQEWDKSFSRWEPHLNLLYPFIHKKNFFRAKQCIEQAIQEHSIEKFRVDFPPHHVYCREFSKFVLTSPCEQAQLEQFQKIYRVLKEIFPQCSSTGSSLQEHASTGRSLSSSSSSSKEEEEGNHEEFHPHLTLGQLSNSNLANVKSKHARKATSQNSDDNENEFEKLKQAWMGGSFEATEIVFLWRENVEDPFHVAERISLL
nr:unnamed protein product [Naegleria fowleri]